jgi:hypothetical protein
MNPLPESPDGLGALLSAIFPAFNCAAEDNEWPELHESRSFHAVMRDFTEFFGRSIDSFSDKQLAQLAELIVLALKQPGSLENAIDTCFLDHTRQIKVNRKLAPWLSKARSKHGA